MENKHFQPDGTITREQMAVMMEKYAEKLGKSLPITQDAIVFADADKIQPWAAEAVEKMQQAGILSGKDKNCFDPQGIATRAEVAVVLHRFAEI